MKQVEQWDFIEIDQKGTEEGNPFLEVEFGARFSLGHRTVDVDGFYDGDGNYKVRFMPDVQGEWRVAFAGKPYMAMRVCREK